MKRPVTISNPEKRYFPSGFRKVDMIRYYAAVAETMLPHVRDRPITLIRFPEGVGGETFYEKNAPGHAPAWIETAQVSRRHHEGHINYILLNNMETIAWCANLGAIEFHPFLHKASALSRPTHIAFDLDPGEGADLLTCIQVAHILKNLFESLDLECFPKVSGSKGLQLYVPLNTPTSYDETTPFAKAVAELLAKQFPDLVVSDMAKVLRRGKVLIDWSQNSEAKTTVSVYSLRGKHDQPFVSAPVTWEELDAAAKAKDKSRLFFGPDAVLTRIREHGDLFAPVLKLKQTLPKNLKGGDAAPKASLRRYAEKRNFAKTAEPSPAVPRRSHQGSTRRFVIQKHAASHLHFDFRLEMGDALKSWAVPKGLPYEKDVRRSAFEVEDHPIDYLTFEGTIPEGQYGGGTVMVWDIGTYEIIEGNYYGGRLKLWLAGKKLKGEWDIVRIKGDEEKPRWLITKGGKAMKPLTKAKETTSALSGRTLEEIAKDNDAQWQSNRSADTKEPLQTRAKEEKPSSKKRKQTPAPRFVDPMKPQLVERLPEGEEWSYEIKWDGYRALLMKHGDEVHVWSRNENNLDKSFPGILAAGASLNAHTCLIDGEIVALDDKGHPSFQALQNRASTDHAIVYYAFDLLSLEGRDFRSLPLSERQDALAELLEGSTLRRSSVLPGTAKQVIEAVSKLGLEGVVAKRRGSEYRSGDRTSDWQKVRLRRGQEFVIGGYRPGMHPFESILVGYYRGKDFVFAGKVRPGLTATSRKELWELFRRDETSQCPFSNLPDALKKGRWGEGITAEEMKTLKWLKPKHVVDIEFVEWTSNGHLRHAAYRGRRPDKKPKDVTREGGPEAGE